MDLGPLFQRCLVNDVDGVLAELELLRRLALDAAGPIGLSHDVEVAYTPRRQFRALQDWSALVALGPAGQLKALLQSARDSVPHFRQRFASLPSGAELRLEDFDPVSRDEMASNPAAFYQDGLDPNQGRALHITSGTAGRPLIVWFDDAMYYDICVSLYAEVVENVPGVMDRIAPGSISVVQLSNHPMTWNGTTRLLALKFSVLRRLILEPDLRVTDVILSELNPAVVSGTGSTVLTFLHGLAGQRPLARPGVIFLSGETLYADVRRRIEDSFGCPCVDVYISSEGGGIAFERDPGCLSLRDHAAKLEVLLPSGLVASEGEGELLVTNLLNQGMPFIRYRSGDHGRLEIVPGQDGRSVTQIRAFYGRDVPAYDLGGTRVASAEIGYALEAAGVTNFRFERQGAAAFTLTYETNRTGCLEPALHAALAPLLLGADVKFVRVAHVPRSGKKTLRFSTQP